MLRKVFMSVLCAVMVLSLTACVMEFDNAGSMLSKALQEYKESVELGDKYKGGESIELNLDMQVAKAVIDSTEDKLADVRFSYNSKALKPEFVVEDDEISISNKLSGNSFGKPVNIWDVKLSDKVPMEVALKADASDVKLDMSGMLISSVDAALNASTAKIYFDEPNKELLDKFKLDADASSASIYGAGNIGYETLDIDANASMIMVDLTGNNERDGEVRIDANASTIKLKLPENVGAKIIIDKYDISSVKLNNSDVLSSSDKEYVTKDYGKTESTLKIYADLNVTTLTIE